MSFINKNNCPIAKINDDKPTKAHSFVDALSFQFMNRILLKIKEPTNADIAMNLLIILIFISLSPSIELKNIAKIGKLNNDMNNDGLSYISS